MLVENQSGVVRLAEAFGSRPNTPARGRWAPETSLIRLPGCCDVSLLTWATRRFLFPLSSRRLSARGGLLRASAASTWKRACGQQNRALTHPPPRCQQPQQTGLIAPEMVEDGVNVDAMTRPGDLPGVGPGGPGGPIFGRRSARWRQTDPLLDISPHIGPFKRNTQEFSGRFRNPEETLGFGWSGVSDGIPDSARRVGVCMGRTELVPIWRRCLAPACNW